MPFREIRPEYMSIWHLLILLVILLLVFGPQKLEGIGTSLGRAVRGFKKGLEEDSPAINVASVVTVAPRDNKEPAIEKPL